MKRTQRTYREALDGQPADEQEDNTMFVVESAFHISRKKEEAACAALIALATTRVGTLSWRVGDIQAMVVKTGRPVSQLTFDELVACWGWQLLRNGAENIFGIQLQEDFSSDEKSLFVTLAPFVTKGCFIRLEGKRRGGEWRTCYGFTGTRIVEQEAACPAVLQEKEDDGKNSTAGKKHSKRHYRKTLFWLRTIVAVTMQTLSEGESEGQEYSFLDQVAIYEQALAMIAAAIDRGLKPVEKKAPENVVGLPTSIGQRRANT